MELTYLRTPSATIAWDIERMSKDIYDGKCKYILKPMPIVNLIIYCDLYPVEDVYACDICDFPVVIMLGGGKYHVAKGMRQILKARKLHFWDLECYVVDARTQKRYIINYDKEIYKHALREEPIYERKYDIYNIDDLYIKIDG